ncbi:MAG TPA: hypothetical protein VHC49_20515 [Mycobacteriales bacterium]|nr:hypothetical protein [Mycobacteriales bacterium]
MTTIKVNPEKLHGVGRSIAEARPDVDLCATAAKAAKPDLTDGVGSSGEAFRTLAGAADDLCRAAHVWFTVCGNSVSALAKKASSAADTYKHTDENVYVTGPNGKPLPAPR